MHNWHAAALMSIFPYLFRRGEPPRDDFALLAKSGSVKYTMGDKPIKKESTWSSL